MYPGYLPPKNRTILKRRFHNKYSSSQYTNDRLFRRSKNLILYQTLLFWVLMLFSLRIGSICFFSLASAGRSYYGLKLSLPKAVMNKRFVITDDKNTIRIWLDRSEIMVINSDLVKICDFKNALLKYDQQYKYKKVFFHADKECTMGLITPIIMELRKSGYNEIIFVTYGSTIGIW